MNAQASSAPAEPPPSLTVLAGLPDTTPLTRVALARIDQHFDLYLRFGEPVRTLQLDRWRSTAMFLPNAVFCRVRWQASDDGVAHWQLMVMQACTPLDGAQRIPGVQPGARLLLHAKGHNPVHAVLARIGAIETLGIEPAATAPAYWRMLASRLAARLPLPENTDEQHAGWLAGRGLP